MFLDHAVHAFGKNFILRLEKFVTWIGPLLNRLLDESPSDNERIIIGEFACLGSTIRMRNRTVERG